MAAQADERVMISERIAPGMLPRVLNSFDMTIIFVAIVLFIVNASAIQQAHQAAFTYWILGFVAFLIPGALVTAQLGQMFPQEGSLYVWTQLKMATMAGTSSSFILSSAVCTLRRAPCQSAAGGRDHGADYAAAVGVVEDVLSALACPVGGEEVLARLDAVEDGDELVHGERDGLRLPHGLAPAMSASAASTAIRRSLPMVKYLSLPADMSL